MSTWLITPLGPIVARDGRPFGSDSGNRMKLTPWLYPSVAAGSFRTMVGKRRAEGFTPGVVSQLKEISVAGPLPYLGNQIYFPAPKDIIRGESNAWVPLRPALYREGEGTDLPISLLPVGPADSVADFKPRASPAWWSLRQMTTWLLDKEPDSPEGDGFMTPPITDLRTHVALNDELGASEEGLLFQTAGIQFADNVQMAVHVSDIMDEADGIHPFGGERHLAAWRRVADNNAWACPPEIANELHGARNLRMILATPAIFSGGWKPSWLGPDLKGTIPGTTIKVRLIGACVERWKPVSGWSLETGNRGEKPVRRVVPAGSVYFFEREGEGHFDVAEAWLKPVSDITQLSLDGFGVALWGKWKPEGEQR